jgi:hypothetical protein
MTALPLQMNLNWNPIIDPDFFNYEGSHVMFPLLLVLLYQSSGPIKYWPAAFFSVSMAAIWEVLEVLAQLTMDSYVLFGLDNDSHEPIVDVVLLDIGNGIIGVAIGLLLLLALQPQFRDVTVWVKTTIFLIFGCLYSYLSSFGSCKSSACTELVTPWGNYANMVLVSLYSYFFLYTHFTDARTTTAYASNAILLLLATSIRWKSSAITVYIASGVLICFWGVVYLRRRDGRSPRAI